MPELQRLLIGDDPQSWEAAGFTISGGETVIGRIAVRFVDSHRPNDDDNTAGVIGWEFTGLTDVGVTSVAEDGIDGIHTTGAVEAVAPPKKGDHRNRVSRMDHVVVMTPDIHRTVLALENAGFSPSRTRDVPGTEPPKRQVFLWAGETILEVVGPVTAADSGPATGSGPATIWGLALTTDDMDAAVKELGSAVSAPKKAVQPGRRIATIKTRDLGISTALALMTPHVSAGDQSGSDHSHA